MGGSGEKRRRRDERRTNEKKRKENGKAHGLMTYINKILMIVLIPSTADGGAVSPFQGAKISYLTYMSLVDVSEVEICVASSHTRQKRKKRDI